MREVSFYGPDGVLVATHICQDGMTPRSDLRRALVGVSVEAAVSAALDDPYPALVAYYDAVGKGVSTSHNYSINGVPGVASWTPLRNGMMAHEGHTIVRPRKDRREFAYSIKVSPDGRWLEPRGPRGELVPLCRDAHIAEIVRCCSIEALRPHIDPDDWRGLQRCVHRAMALRLPSAVGVRHSIDGSSRYLEFLPADDDYIDCRVTIAL